MLRRKRPTSFLSKVQTDVEAATAKKKKKRAREIPPSLKDVTNKEMTSALCAEEERERISLFSLFLPEQKKKNFIGFFLGHFSQLLFLLGRFFFLFPGLDQLFDDKKDDFWSICAHRDKGFRVCLAPKMHLFFFFNPLHFSLLVRT